jgi:hypothetical protein
LSRRKSRWKCQKSAEKTNLLTNSFANSDVSEVIFPGSNWGCYGVGEEEEEKTSKAKKEKATELAKSLAEFIITFGSLCCFSTPFSLYFTPLQPPENIITATQQAGNHNNKKHTMTTRKEKTTQMKTQHNTTNTKER